MSLVGREEGVDDGLARHLAQRASGVGGHHGLVEGIGTNDNHQFAGSDLDGVGGHLVGSHFLVGRLLGSRGGRLLLYFGRSGGSFGRNFDDLLLGFDDRRAGVDDGFAFCLFFVLAVILVVALHRNLVDAGGTQGFGHFRAEGVGKVYRLSAPFGQSQYQFGLAFVQGIFVGNPFLGYIFLLVAAFAVGVAYLFDAELALLGLAEGAELVGDAGTVQREGTRGKYNPLFAHADYLPLFLVGIDDAAGFVLILLQAELHPLLHAFEDFVLRHAGDAEFLAEDHFAVFFGNGSGQILAVVALLGLEHGGQAQAEEYEQDLCHSFHCVHIFLVRCQNVGPAGRWRGSGSRWLRPGHGRRCRLRSLR